MATAVVVILRVAPLALPVVTPVATVHVWIIAVFFKK
jgi:hypothetical protein